MAPVAEDDGGKKRRGHYWTGHRHSALMEDAEAVAEAARRTVGKLGARKIATTEAPIVFDPDVARSIVGSFAGCILGGSLFRRASYLLEREGTEAAAPSVDIVDDPLIPRALRENLSYATARTAFASEPRGGARCAEDVPLLTLQRAQDGPRVDGIRAARGGASIGASTTNFIPKAGTLTPESIIASTERGLYVTELMGFGFP